MSPVSWVFFSVLLLKTLGTGYGANCPNDAACAHEGTCPDTTKPCDCSTNIYVGDTCAQAPCAINTDCGPGGICLDGAPKTCKCATGLYGKQCKDVCRVDTDCRNGGTCDTAVTPTVCRCAGTFSGTTCTEACTADTDCLNGGTCDTATKTCKCSGTYSGAQCADACNENEPCLNGGVCTANRCLCVGTFTGAQCANACTKDTDCNNMGTCNTATRTCLCKDGYTGVQCQNSGSAMTVVTTPFILSIIASCCTY